MTDDTRSDATCTHPHRRKHGLLFLFLAAGLLGALIVVPAAVAGGRAMGHFAGGPCWRGDGELTQEDVRDHMGFAADRMLRRVDTTDEQTAQVDALLDGLAPALLEQRLADQDLHEEIAAALTAEQVDAGELERLRAELMVHVNDGSTLVTDALVTLADILTPEQRAELLEIGRRMHGGH